MESVLIYKSGFLDIESGKSPTHIVQHIHIDNHSSVIDIGILKGITVNQYKMTMERAREIGFINISALKILLK
jgi:predicted metal-dependent TIM-barrel fold hydrolase